MNLKFSDIYPNMSVQFISHVVRHNFFAEILTKCAILWRKIPSVHKFNIAKNIFASHFLCNL